MDKGIIIAIMAMLAATAAIIIAIMGLQAVPVAEEPPETPMPAPTVRPVVEIGLVSGDSEFTELVRNSSPDGYRVSDAGSDAQANITIMYMPEPWEVERQPGQRVIVTDNPPPILVEGVSGVVVEEDSLVDKAWEVLYSYPTHSAPIRLLTLARSRDGYSYQVFESMLAEGKLQDKGVYVAEETEGDPGEWTAAMLSEIPVGLLDTIYAEDAELAKAACAALRQAERNDSVEVICPQLDKELVQLMIEDHWTMGAAVGYSMDMAADMAMDLARSMLEGNVLTVHLAPQAICSDDVFALVKQGVTDAEEIMAQLMYGDD